MSENFAGLIAAVARQHPDRIALCWDDGALSYGELADRIDDCARRLLADGVRPGERLAVAIPNRVEFVTTVLGGMAAGAIVAPLDMLDGATGEDGEERHRDEGTQLHEDLLGLGGTYVGEPRK